MNLAAIYWNPDKVLFTLPWINRPIVWYGVFFALGFLVGYFILAHLFRGYLLTKPLFIKSDIKNHARFLMTLKNKQNHPFLKGYFASMGETLSQKIKKWNLSIPVDLSFQNALLKSLNDYILQSPENIQVEFQHEAFPFLSSQSRHFSTKKKRMISFRFMFERLFSDCLEDIQVRSKNFSEKVIIYMIISTIIGSRLGHILFYEDVIHYLTHPLEILKTWEGGLASHGGCIAIAFSFYLFVKKYSTKWPDLSVLRLIDLVAIPTILGGAMIRVGNFINQEILGTVTSSIFGVYFAEPMDGSIPCIRHPAQLYEAISYFITFIVLSLLVRNQNALKYKGRISGYFFLLVFGFRFIIEYFKEEQSIHIMPFLKMGQLLSIPGILAGIAILVYVGATKKRHTDLPQSSY